MDEPQMLPTRAAWDTARVWSDRYDADPIYGRTPLDTAALDRSLIATLARRAETWPRAVLLHDGTIGVSWAELIALSGRIAAMLTRTEPRRTPVGILMQDGILCAAALFAGLIAGRVLVLLDPTSPAARSHDILREAGARHVLADRPPGFADDSVEPILLDATTLPSDPIPPHGADPLGLDAPAFIVTTSGSTGRPKLLVYSQRGIAHRMQQYAAAMGLEQGDRLLTGSGGIASYIGLCYLCTTLYAGTVTYIGSIRQLGIRGLFARLRQDRITAFRGPPSLLRTLAASPGAAQAFALVRKVRLSSEASTWGDIASMRAILPAGCRITNSYGSTEAGSFTWLVSDHPVADPTRVLAGIPQAGMEAVVTREDGSVADPDEPGALFVRSRYCALSEFEDGQLRAGRLIPDPTDPAIRIYATGDLARLSPDGIFVVLGRLDRMLKINGLRVEPIEIEAALRAIPGIRDAAVLPRVQGNAVTLIGFVATDPSAPAPEALRRHLAERLPPYMVPTRILRLDTLPTLPSGKVDAMSLLALDAGSGG